MEGPRLPDVARKAKAGRGPECAIVALFGFQLSVPVEEIQRNLTHDLLNRLPAYAPVGADFKSLNHLFMDQVINLGAVNAEQF